MRGKYRRLYNVLMDKALLHGHTRDEADSVIRKYIEGRKQFDKFRIVR